MKNDYVWWMPMIGLFCIPDGIAMWVQEIKPEIGGENQNAIENGSSHEHSMGFIFVKVPFFFIWHVSVSPFVPFYSIYVGWDVSMWCECSISKWTLQPERLIWQWQTKHLKPIIIETFNDHQIYVHFLVNAIWLNTYAQQMTNPIEIKVFK